MKLFSDYVNNSPHEYAVWYTIQIIVLKNKDVLVFVFILIKLDSKKSSSIPQFNDFLNTLQEAGFSIIYVKINTRNEIREAVLLFNR